MSDKWDSALEGLRKLALQNERDFRAEPLLLDRWRENTRTGRHLYTLDADGPMCGGGALDCWSTYRELLGAQDPGALAGRPDPAAKIRLDCEDAAAALAAALEITAGRAVVGVKPGVTIGHAIAGFERPGGQGVIWFDPAEWAGMSPISPEGARALRLHP